MTEHDEEAFATRLRRDRDALSARATIPPALLVWQRQRALHARRLQRVIRMQSMLAGGGLAIAAAWLFMIEPRALSLMLLPVALAFALRARA